MQRGHHGLVNKGYMGDDEPQDVEKGRWSAAESSIVSASNLVLDHDPWAIVDIVDSSEKWEGI